MLSSKFVKTLRLATLLTVSAAAFGAAETPLLDTMSKELQRNFAALKQKAEPPPYFMAYEITEIEGHSVGATLGVLNSTGDSRNRFLDTTIRVGDPKLDNYRRVRGDNFRFTSAQPIPIDDIPNAIAQRMWLETDRVYRAAADRLIRIKTNQQVKAVARDQSPDFSSEESYVHIGKPATVTFDTAKWSQQVRAWSGDFSKYPDLLSSGVQVSAQVDNRYIVNTEGTKVSDGRGYARITISAGAKAKDGMDVSDFQAFEALDPSGLPGADVIRAAIKTVGEHVEALLSAPMAEPYAGPAIFPAALRASSFMRFLDIELRAIARKTKRKARPLPRKWARKFCPIFSPSLSILPFARWAT